MEKFKIPSHTSNSFLNRQRHKSDQLPLKESNLLLPSHVSVKRLPNSLTSLYKPTVLIRNPSTRSQSNEMKSIVSLDLSRIRVCANKAPSNLSARNANYNKNPNSIYLRKRSTDGVCMNLSDRGIKNENMKILPPGPNVHMLCCNKFIERLSLYESKLQKFYNK